MFFSKVLRLKGRLRDFKVNAPQTVHPGAVLCCVLRASSTGQGVGDSRISRLWVGFSAGPCFNGLASEFAREHGQ